MKVRRMETAVVRVPLPQPIPSGKMLIRSADAVLVTLHTDEGLTGEGMVFTLNGHRLGLVHDMIRSLEPLVVGLDPGMSASFWDRAWADMAFLGHRGLPVVGLAPIDMALWDLRGKQAGMNVSRLLGAHREKMPIYRSGGLRLSNSIDELQAEAASFVAQGFRAMKMSLGKPTIEEDVARVRAVQEVIGPSVNLMADCHQQLTVPQAIRLGRELEPHRLTWIEEPVVFHDHMGEAAVALALNTPIASGESEYTRLGIAEMLRCKSADILMPDLQRMGGPTEMMKVACLADAANVPVAPHLFTEMCLSLAAAMPNAIYVECMPWFAPLYDKPLSLDKDGCAQVPEGPGWGMSFDRAAVARFAC